MLCKLQRTMWVEGSLAAVGLKFPFTLCSPCEKARQKCCARRLGVCSGPGALGMDGGDSLALCRLKSLHGGEPSLPRSPEGCGESSRHIRSANPLGLAPQNPRNSLHPICFLRDESPSSKTEFGCIHHVPLEVFRSPLQVIPE